MDACMAGYLQPRLSIARAAVGSWGRWYHKPMSTYHTDSRVDDYIDALPDWQQDICRCVRNLVHAADPNVTETIKRTNRPYFTLDGNICALLAARDHINIFIYDPIAPDPEGIINQGQGNLTARAIQVRQGETLNERSKAADSRDIRTRRTTLTCRRWF